MTRRKEIVKAFLANVDFLGQDPREQIHLCTEAELASQLNTIAEANGLQSSERECLFLAHRLREIFSFPEPKETQ